MNVTDDMTIVWKHRLAHMLCGFGWKPCRIRPPVTPDEQRQFGFHPICQPDVSRRILFLNDGVFNLWRFHHLQYGAPFVRSWCAGFSETSKHCEVYLIKQCLFSLYTYVYYMTLHSTLKGVLLTFTNISYKGFLCKLYLWFLESCLDTRILSTTNFSRSFVRKQIQIVDLF